MAGLKAGAPTPQALTVHSQSRVLEISFSDGAQFRIPFELMRVYSPSAEVQGHGPGQETLQTGKRDVTLETLDPVGNYAVQPRFSDTSPASFPGTTCTTWATSKSACGRTMPIDSRQPTPTAMRPWWQNRGVAAVATETVRY